MKRIFFLMVAVLLATSTMAQSKTGAKLNDRTFFRFHLGFNNWGSSPFNGLQGMSDPAYDLRTTPSSYQLSFGYNLLNTSHLEVGVGIGYESDVYKFTNPYVVEGLSGSPLMNAPTTDLKMSTKLCTRYVTLPIGVAWRTDSKGGFGVRLSAIPGLSYSGSHTGLKNKGANGMDRNDLKGVLNPYKLDMRVDIMFSGIGLFLQVATMPVFLESGDPDAFPIKFGFVL